MNFIESIRQAWSKNNSLLCVGLDPDLAKLPAHLLKSDEPIFEFNKAIVDATHDLVCCYKPQIAFYSAHGAEIELVKTIDYIHQNYADVPVILDSKRSDIGNTASMYALEAFQRYKADALTVNPYLGFDSLKPFLDWKDKGVVILCRTSNEGAKDLQDLQVMSESRKQKLYQMVAEKASTEWNYNNNIMLVIGATYPAELKEVRSIVGSMPLLLPGVGAQGADVKEAVINGIDKDGAGIVINSSRGIIFAGNDHHFADQARKAAVDLRDQINSFRKN